MLQLSLVLCRYYDLEIEIRSVCGICLQNATFIMTYDYLALHDLPCCQLVQVQSSAHFVF